MFTAEGDLGMRGEAFYLKRSAVFSDVWNRYNDSAVAVAEELLEVSEKFAVEKKIQKAAEIGCKDTHFITPNGLDAKDAEGVPHLYDGQRSGRSCVRCIMISTERDTFLEVTRAKEYQFQDTEKKRSFPVIIIMHFWI